MTRMRTVLIVDDDAAMRQMLESLFREQGYAVDEAPDGDAPQTENEAQRRRAAFRVIDGGD